MKKTIIIVVIILVVAGAAVAVMLWIQNGEGSGAAVTGTGGTTTGSLPTPGPTTSSTGTAPVFMLGDATVPPGEITTTMPADASQGDTIQLQVATGTVTLSNFYTTAQGYWPSLDALVIAANATYTIWYYRDSSQFSIVLALGATSADADNAASILASHLGVGLQELCALPVSTAYMIDHNMDSLAYPLDFCTTPAVTNPQ